MIAPDSSVLIAGADPTHSFHVDVLDDLVEVRDAGVLIAHSVAEVTAVLTAAAYAHSPARVREYLSQFSEREPVGVEPADYPRAVAELTKLGVVGGAIYDGPVPQARLCLAWIAARRRRIAAAASPSACWATERPPP